MSLHFDILSDKQAFTVDGVLILIQNSLAAARALEKTELGSISLIQWERNMIDRIGNVAVLSIVYTILTDMINAGIPFCAVFNKNPELYITAANANTPSQYYSYYT